VTDFKKNIALCFCELLVEPDLYEWYADCILQINHSSHCCTTHTKNNVKHVQEHASSPDDILGT